MRPVFQFTCVPKKGIDWMADGVLKGNNLFVLVFFCPQKSSAFNVFQARACPNIEPRDPVRCQSCLCPASWPGDGSPRTPLMDLL